MGDSLGRDSAPPSTTLPAAAGSESPRGDSTSTAEAERRGTVRRFDRVLVHRVLSALVLLSTLLLLASLASPVGLPSERPYEASLYRVALRRQAALWPSPAALWNEHPLLPYWTLRLVHSLDGRDVRITQAVSSAVYLAALGLSLWFVTRRASRDAPNAALSLPETIWLRGLLTLTAFVAPFTLVGAMRLLPDGVAYFALAGILAGGHWLWTSRSPAAGVVLGVAASALAESHAYGAVVAFGLLLGWGIALPLRQQPRTLLGFSIAAVLFGVSMLADAGGHLARFALLKDHYWAVRIMSGRPPVPFVSIWYAASEAMSDAIRLAPASMQVVLLALLTWIACRSRDRSARACALGFLGSCAVLWIAEVATGEEVVVPHWLGPLWIVAFCSIARALSGWALRTAVAVGVLIVFMPAVITVSAPSGDGPAALRAAAWEIRQLSADADAVVFGGTRAYILFEPFLDDPLLERSVVYLRQEIAPDRFVGRELIPSQRLVGEDDWRRFDRRRIVVVLLEAAQKVDVPTNDYRMIAQRRVVHNAYSLGLITVELREKP